MGETSDHRFLKFGKIWMEGGSRAQLIQCLHIEVTNTGPLDYRGVWYPIDMKKGNMTDVCPSTVVEVPAEETKDITIMFYFKEPGTYELGDVFGNVTISSSATTLRNTTVAGNLYISGGLELGSVTLENVRVLGDIIVAGGGVHCEVS